ncbi:MAG: hypothetical protein ACXVB0_13465 [Mucilaginibacter sp.]
MTTERSGGVITYLKQRHAIRTTTYHAISLPAVAYIGLSHQYAGGPCTPGLGMLSFVFSGLMDFGLILVSLVLLAIKGRPYLLTLVLNLAALGILLLLSIWAR